MIESGYWLKTPEEDEAEKLVGRINAGEFDGKSDEEKKAASDQLDRFRKARQFKEEETRREDIMSGYDSMDNVPWTPEDDAVSNELGTYVPDEKARRQNIRWLANEWGMDESDVSDNLDLIRPEMAKGLGIKNPEKATDLQIYDTLAKRRKDEREEEETYAGVMDRGIAAAIDGDPTQDFGTALMKSLGEGEQLSPERKKMFAHVYGEVQAMMTEHRETMEMLRDVAGKQTGLKKDAKTEKTLGDLADAFSTMSDSDQDKALSFVVAYYRSQGKDKGFLYQLGESIGRGGGAMYSHTRGMFDEAKLEGIEQALKTTTPLYWKEGDDTSITHERELRDRYTGELPEGYTLVPVEHYQEALNGVRRLKTANQVKRKLRKIIESDVDPIKVLSKNAVLGWLEQGAYDAAGSIPYMVAAAVPYVGWAYTTSAMVADKYDDLRLRYPDMPVWQAQLISTAIGIPQGVIEKTSAEQILTRIPGVRNFMEHAANPAAWRNFGKRWFEQWSEEMAQEGISIVFEGISASMGASMPGWNWMDQMRALPGTAGQNAAATLFFALPGRYRSKKHGEGTLFRNVLDSGNRDQLAKFGYSEEQIASIVAAPRGEARDAVAAQEWSRRPENLAQEAYERAEAEVKAEATIHQRAADAGEEVPVPVQIGDKFGLRHPDGKVSEYDTAEEMVAALQRMEISRLRGDAPLNDAMYQFFSGRTDVDWKKLDAAKGLNEFVKEGLATPEQVQARIDVAGIGAGHLAEVDGYTQSEIRDGVLRHTIALVNDASPDVIVEEVGHTAYRNALARGQIKYNQFVDAVRAYGRRVKEFNLDDPFLTKEQIRTRVDEGIADMVKATFFGRLREIDQLQPGLRAFFLKLARMLKEIFRRAFIVKQMAEKGEITGEIQTFLSQAAGLEAPPAVTETAFNTLEYLRGTGSRPLAFGIRTTVAPTRVDTLAEFTEEDIRKRTESETFKKLQATVDEVAEVVGVKITARYPTIGGWSEEGSLSLEVPEVIELDTDNWDVAMDAAAMLGTLAPELQNGVFLWKDEGTGKDSMYTFQATSPEAAARIAKHLNTSGQKGFSYDFKTRTFAIAVKEATDEDYSRLNQYIEQQASFGNVGRGVRPAQREAAEGVSSLLSQVSGTAEFIEEDSYAGRLQEARSKYAGAAGGKADQVISRAQQRLTGIAFSIRETEIAQPDPSMDASRVGTALTTKVPFDQQSNISIDKVPKAVLVKQMARFREEAYDHLPKHIRNIKAGKPKDVPKPPEGSTKKAIAEYEKAKKAAQLKVDYAAARKMRDAFVQWSKDNLLELYHAFPEEYRTRATHWYDGAHKLARELGDWFGLSVEQAAGLYAVFSPQRDWFQNVAIAQRVASVLRNGRNVRITGKAFEDEINYIVDAVSLTPGQKKKPNAAEILAERKAKTRETLESLYGSTIEDLAAIRRADPENEKAATAEAWAVRLVTTIIYGKDYRIVSPEGDLGDWKLTDKGDRQKMSWGGARDIEKAISIFENGSVQNISAQLGEKHKVRNFYNNIVAPNSPARDITADTHAVAAAHLLPIGSKDPLVGDNFGGAASSAAAGVSGTYHLYADAYRAAAEEMGLQARQMQSITWEAIRLLYTPDDRGTDRGAGGLLDKVRHTWQSIDPNDARRKIAGSKELPPPDWAGPRRDLGFGANLIVVAGEGPRLDGGGPGLHRDAGRHGEAGARRDAGLLSFSVRPKAGSRVAFEPDIDRLAWELNRFNPNPEEKLEIRARTLQRLRELQNLIKYRESTANPELASLQATASLAVMVAAMPPEVRGKFPPSYFTTLQEKKRANTRTAQLIKMADKLEGLLEAHLKSEYTERIEDIFKASKAKDKKTGAGFASDYVNDALAAWKRGDPEESSAELEKLDSILRGDNPRIPATGENMTRYGRLHALERLYGGHEGMTAERLAEAWKALKETREAGMARWRESEEKRRERNQAMAEQAVKAVGVETGRKPETESLAKEERFRRMMKGQVVSHYTLNQLLELTFGTTSGLAKRFTNKIRKATGAAEDSRGAAAGRMHDMFKELLGTRFMFPVVREMGRLREKKDHGFTYIDGRKVENIRVPIPQAREAVTGQITGYTDAEVEQLRDGLSMLEPGSRARTIEIERELNPGEEKDFGPVSLDEMTYLVMTWDQEDGRRLLERQGLSEATMLEMRRLVLDNRSAAALLNFLRKEYEDGHKPIDAVYRRMYGMPLPKIRNYSPLRIQMRGDEKDINMEGGYSPSGMSPGSLHSRVMHSRPIDMHASAMGTFMSHNVSMAHWIAFAETIRELRAVVSEDKVMQAITIKHGEQYAQNVQQMIKIVAEDGIRSSAGLSIWDKIVGKFYSAAAISILGGSLRTVLMQSDNLFRFALALPKPQQFMRGIAAAIQNPERWKKVWKSSSIQRRLENGFSPEVRAMMNKANASPSDLMHLAQLGMLPMQYYDAFGMSVTGWVVYEYHHGEFLKQGMDEATADRLAMDQMDLAINTYAQPTATSQRSRVEYQGTAAKLLYMFASDARLKTALYMRAWGDALKGENRAENIWRIVWIHSLFLVGEGLKDFWNLLTADDDDDVFNWVDYVTALVLGPTAGLYYVGAGVEVFANKITGGYMFDRSENPMRRVAVDSMRLVTDPGKLIDPDKAGKSWRAATTLISEIAAMSGIAPVAAGGAMAAELTHVLSDAIDMANREGREK